MAPSTPASNAATRPRRARGSLTETEILDSAEHVAAGGIDGLTMRGVATAIGASPMALYRYFATKDELTEAMVNRVLLRVEVPEPTPHWRADLQALAESHRKTLMANKWAIPFLFTHPDPGLGARRIGDAATSTLARAGIEGADALAAFSALLAMNYGWVSFAAANSPALGPASAESNYRRALNLLLDGIEANAAR